MATDDRDEFEDEYDDPAHRPRSPEALVRDARARLAAPSLLLILSAVVMLLFGLVGVGVLASGYDTGLAAARVMADLQPPGPQKQELEQKIQDMVGRDRTGEYVQGAVFSAAELALSLVMLLGGLRMRQVRGYGWSVAGAVCGIVPHNACCCLGLPVGVWALVVLSNPGVKAAFAANRFAGIGGSGDDLDPGFGPER